MRDVEIYADEVMLIDEVFTSGNGFKEVDLDPGTAMLWDIYKNSEVHIVRVFLSAGATLPMHVHLESVETLVLISGDSDVLCEDEDCKPQLVTLTPGRPVFLEPNKKHKVHARVDSKYIVVFVPPDKALV